MKQDDVSRIKAVLIIGIFIYGFFGILLFAIMMLTGLTLPIFIALDVALFAVAIIDLMVAFLKDEKFQKLPIVFVIFLEIINFLALIVNVIFQLFH